MSEQGAFQGELLHRGYEELSPDQRRRDQEYFEAVRATKEAASEAQLTERTRWETADYPYPLEVLEFDRRGGLIPSSEMLNWLHRQALNEDIRRNYSHPEQLSLDQLSLQDTEGSRATD